MSVEAATALAKGIIMLGIGASAIGEGIAVASAFNAIGRNPKLEDSLFTKMIIGCAIIESTAIYGLVAFFVL
ncbi:ATP synthase F0 subunit C [Candidatus Dojkabacteria bacterium]|nr:ATP synthase F0 subunit C [Candidatus Dojkabacteria bacterium]